MSPGKFLALVCLATGQSVVEPGRLTLTTAAVSFHVGRIFQRIFSRTNERRRPPLLHVNNKYSQPKSACRRPTTFLAPGASLAWGARVALEALVRRTMRKKGAKQALQTGYLPAPPQPPPLMAMMIRFAKGARRLGLASAR